MSIIRIETTQNVIIEYEAGSLGDRILAWITDFLILFGYTILLLAILGSLKLDDEFWYIILLSMPWFFYDLVAEIFFHGQSVGKAQLKLKVVALNGKQPSIGKYLLRWLFRPIDMILLGPGLVAVLVMLGTGKGQRLGDIVAGTALVSTKKRHRQSAVRMPDLEDDYEPVFPEVTLLKDRDIAIIKEAIAAYKLGETNIPTNSAAQKVKEVLQIEPDLPPLRFLKTVVKDYYHLAG
jgi:uncharacterized RDD family membrane protein YckC